MILNIRTEVLANNINPDQTAAKEVWLGSGTVCHSINKFWHLTHCRVGNPHLLCFMILTKNVYGVKPLKAVAVCPALVFVKWIIHHPVIVPENLLRKILQNIGNGYFDEIGNKEATALLDCPLLDCPLIQMD